MSRSIADRLIEWEERRDRGETVSAADLCADAPELAPQVARLIRLLESAERLLDVSATEPMADAGPGARLPPRPARLPAHVGRYEVRAELGRGATCVVYLARDPELGRDVALKVLHDEAPLGRPEQSALAVRLGREARALARLRHDHIVPIYEPGLSEGRPFFVLEYVRGGSLRDRLAELSAAGPRAFVPLLVQVARAVQYAHEQGYLHRDLKPANILLADDGRALVSDFGLVMLLGDAPAPRDEATVDTVTDPPPGAPGEPGRQAAAETVAYEVPEASDASARLTATGFQPGTPAYMAPEQYDPAFGEVGPATDVWALGVLLYELLTGQKPFPGRTRNEVRAQVCGGRPVRPRQRRPGADRGLEAIALRCLETDPRRRYRTAAEFATALAGWQARRRWPRRLAVAALVASLAGLGGFLWLSPERRYLRATEESLAALRRNEQVNFIPTGATHVPPHRVRAGEPLTTVGRTDDGLLVEGRDKCCLVELCPAVPLEHYRVRATLRATKLFALGPAWGIYVNYAPVHTDPGPQHYFEAACFFDALGKPSRPLGSDRLVVEAGLALRCFSYHHTTTAPNGDYPYRDLRGTPVPGKSLVRSLVPDGKEGNSWRTIQIDVHAGDVSARCGGEGVQGELSLGTLRSEYRALWLEGLGADNPDLRGIGPTVRGTGVGVYVDSAICNVREFVIEPLVAP